MKVPQTNQLANSEVTDLIELYLQSGDKNCLGKIYENYKQKLFFHCLKILNNEEDAKDKTSETFIKAFEKFQTFDLKKPFYPWLMQISTNLCIDFIRRKKIVQYDQIENHQELSVSNNQVGDLENIELKERIKAAICKLKRKQKRCFCLFYIHERSYKEIVKVTGFSENEVRSFIQNGRRKVKLNLEREKISANLVLINGSVILSHVGWQATLIMNNFWCGDN